jgi:hypothetical protein
MRDAGMLSLASTERSAPLEGVVGDTIDFFGILLLVFTCLFQGRRTLR